MKWPALIPAVLFIGCANQAAREPAKPPVQIDQSAQIASIDAWRADGRVAIARGAEGYSARLRWLQQDDSFQLRLIAPLGRGTYQLAGNPAAVELLVPSGEAYRGRDAESLMRDHLGWSIPVAGAEYWLRGLPAPTSEPTYVHRDEQGFISDMEQDGWRISVLKRRKAANFDLPAKLFLHYRDLKVRIVVSKWTLNPA